MELLFGFLIGAVASHVLTWAVMSDTADDEKKKYTRALDMLEDMRLEKQDAQDDLSSSKEELEDANRQLQEIMLEVAYNGYEVKIVPEKVIPERVEPERVEVKKIGK